MQREPEPRGGAGGCAPVLGRYQSQPILPPGDLETHEMAQDSNPYAQLWIIAHSIFITSR